MKDKTTLARGWFLKADSDLAVADAELIRTLVLSSVDDDVYP